MSHFESVGYYAYMCLCATSELVDSTCLGLTPSTASFQARIQL